MNLFFKNSLFRTLSMANLFSALGQSLFDFVFVLYAGNFPNPELAISIAGMIASLPFLFSFIMGYLADQTRNPIQFLLVTKLAQSAIFLSLAFLSLQTPNWLLFSTFCLLNMTSDWFSNYNSYNSLSLTKRWLSKDDLSLGLGVENGLYSVAAFSAQALGTGLLILFSNNYSVVLIINSFLFFLSFLFILSLKKKEGYIFDEEKNWSLDKKFVRRFLKDFLTNLKLVKNKKKISRLILICLLMNFISSAIYIFMPVSFVSQSWLKLGNFATTLFVIQTVDAVARILGSLFPIKVYRELSLQANIVVEMFLFMAYVVTMTFIQNIGFLLVLSVGISYFSAISTPKLSSFILTEVPEGQSNSIFGIFRTLMTLSVPLASVVITFLIVYLSNQVIWYGLSGFVFFTLGYSIYIWRASHLSQY